MYSRGYDRGIESDGSLRELERDFEENRLVQEAAHQEPALPASVGKGKGKLFSRRSANNHFPSLFFIFPLAFFQEPCIMKS